MIDLLKKHKNLLKSDTKKYSKNLANIDFNETAGDPRNTNPEQEFTEEKVDLGRYRDPEGLTLKKLNAGLWLVKNRRNISLLFHTFLIMVSIITWLIFFLNFGIYVFSGMKKDQTMINELVSENLVGQNYLDEAAAKDLKYGRLEALKTLDGKYDMFINIENQNPSHSLEFDYFFMNNGVRIEGGKNFALPKQAKFLLSLNKDIDGSVKNLTFHLENLKWARINPHIYPDWDDFRNKRLAIMTSEIEFTPGSANKITEKLELNNLDFKTTNNTAFNYRDVNYVILLYSGGEIVGVTKYTLDSLGSEKTEKISIVWPGDLGRVNDIVIYPEINILDEDVYLDFDGGPGELK